MLQTILGKKLEMTNKYTTKGDRVPVTRIWAEPNVVTQLKTIAKDGYFAAQIGFGTKKHTNKPMQGHLKKANLSKAPQKITEVKVAEELFQSLSLGQTISLGDVLRSGTIVDVQGISKGKGFQGGMKRWGFHGGPASHGQSDRARAPGSIGSGTTPGRVYKGKKMAGHMGDATATVKHLTVFDTDPKNAIFEVIGSVPGPKGALLTITVVGQDKKFAGALMPMVKKEAVVEEPAVEEQLGATVDEGAKEVFEAETAEPEKLATTESTEENTEDTKGHAKNTDGSDQ